MFLSALVKADQLKQLNVKFVKSRKLKKDRISTEQNKKNGYISVCRQPLDSNLLFIPIGFIDLYQAMLRQFNSCYFLGSLG